MRLHTNRAIQNMAAAAAGRGILWTDEETDALLQIWKEDYIKKQLSTTHRNSKVFLQFSAKLKDRGFNRSTLQCRVKVKKLRQKYMATRDKLRTSGQSADVKWPLYDVLDEILGTSPCANPMDVVEGGSVDISEDENDDNSSIMDQSSSLSIHASAVDTNDDTNDEATSSSNSADARKGTKSNKDERKSSLQQITTLISSVIEQQKKDHELFLMKEEERHQRELELERERYRLQMEMEERRHRIQIEHDQAMMRMLCQVMSTAVNHTFPPMHTQLYPNQMMFQTQPNEEPSYHNLSEVHQTSATVTTQETSSASSCEQTLSSALHELNNS